MKNSVVFISVLFSIFLATGISSNSDAMQQASWRVGPHEKICGDKLCSEIEFDNYLPPKKQLKSGKPLADITCKEGLDLIFKHADNSPACVKHKTAEKLVERGWAKSGVIPSIGYSSIEIIPAISGAKLNFYINDDDLNLNPSGTDTVSTNGLVQVTINGVEIDIPSSMLETSPNSGRFSLEVTLPDSVGGVALSQGDVILVQYFDETDRTGSAKTVSSSAKLSQSYASFVSSGGTRIGHEFTIRIYEPDANRNSKNEDKISLSSFEFRLGGLRTNLSNPVFDANRSYFVETGPNTDVFEVTIKIPRSIDGRTIHIGDSYEIRYVDSSTQSGTSEKVKLSGRIG